MGYIDRLLDSNEDVVYLARMQKTLFLPPALLLVLALLAHLNRMPYAAMVLFIPGALTAIYLGIIYRTTEFVVTNKRVIGRMAFTRRPPWAVPLEQIRDVRVHRGPLARLLGYGTVRVEDVTGAVRPIRTIEAPEDFRDAILEQRRTAAARA